MTYLIEPAGEAQSPKGASDVLLEGGHRVAQALPEASLPRQGGDPAAWWRSDVPESETCPEK